jgi:hypothetical protein
MSATKAAGAIRRTREIGQLLLNGKFITLPEALDIQVAADLAEQVLLKETERNVAGILSILDELEASIRSRKGLTS